LNYQSKVIKEYRECGYIVLNLIRLSANGYPDLLCLKDGKALFIECKTGGDTLKPLQKYRIDELIKEGFEAFCLKDGEIIYGTKKEI
jgi:Holliday junction resolvase